MTILSLAGRSILIIEDEALIALDLARAFERAGAEVTTTSTLHHAHLLVKHDGLSAAVVDHALGDGDTQSICKYLKEAERALRDLHRLRRPRSGGRLPRRIRFETEATGVRRVGGRAST